MQETNWDNYTSSSLKFVFTESCKMQEETFKGYRECITKGYGAFALYTGLLSYCFNRLVGEGISTTTAPYQVMIIGLLFGIVYLWKTLMPGTMDLPGTMPSKIVVEFFENETFKEGDTQERELIITKIIDNDSAIRHNIQVVNSLVTAFKTSVIIVLLTFFLSLASGFI